MNKEKMIDFLNRTGLSPKRARQMFKTDMRKYNRELLKLESDSSNEYAVKELKEAVSEKMIKVLILNDIINDNK